MPSRWVCLLILASWLASMGWLFHQDIWPWLQPDIPPPFTIDLVDEARQQPQAAILWNVYLERDRPVPRLLQSRVATMLALLASGSTLEPASASLAVHLLSLTHPPQGFVAKSSVEYHERYDDFTFSMRIDPPSNGSKQHLDLGTVKLARMRSTYRVNRLGQLKDMEVEFRFDASVLGLTIKDTEVRLKGEVENDQFTAHYKVDPRGFPLPAEVLKLLEGETEAVKLSYNGSVLLPLHPVNRIRGLRPGQHWRMPLVNPMEEALSRSSFLPVSKKQRFLRARVLPQPWQLPDTEEPVRCLVIEYDDEELQPRTWVQENTGLVLRQEVAASNGQRLIMQREIIPHEP